MTMAKRIGYLVKKHPKNRQQIASELYISPECLGNYITGRRCPDAVMVRKMALYFQVSADYILCVTPTLEDTFPLLAAEQEQSLLSLFRTMTPTQREVFLHSGYGIAHYASIRQALPVIDAPYPVREDGPG